MQLLKRGAPAARRRPEASANRAPSAVSTPEPPSLVADPTKADENVGGAVVHGGANELADAKAAGAKHVSLVLCDEFNPGSGGDVDHARRRCGT